MSAQVYPLSALLLCSVLVRTVPSSRLVRSRVQLLIDCLVHTLHKATCFTFCVSACSSMQPRHAPGRPPSAPNGTPHPTLSDAAPRDPPPHRVGYQEAEAHTTAPRHLAPPTRHSQQSTSYQRQQTRAPLPPLHPNSHHRRSMSPPKDHRTLAVNGTAGQSTSNSATALPSSTDIISRVSSLWARRPLVVVLIFVTLIVGLPLLHLMLTSHTITAALCSSVILASSTLSTKHLPLTPPLLLPAAATDSSSPYQPRLFTLPAPTPYIFLSSHVDASASLHQQLQQFLYAPYLALTLNMSFAYKPLSKAQGEWGRWLGLGWGEVDEDGLLGEWGRVRVFQYEYGVDGRGLEGVEGKEAVLDWVADKRRKLDDINDRLLEYSRNKHKLGNTEAPRIDEPKGSHLNGPDTTALNPNSPINTASVLRLSRMPLPSLQLACYPPLHLLLRQKYCAARVREPAPVDLYGEDRARGRMIVAVHFRCGDDCYHPTRATPLSATIVTLQRITALVSQHSLPSPVFHVFSSPPNNDTAESFFHPLTAAFPTARLHLSVHSHLLLHHLVSSDVLVLPSVTSSGLSWVAELLHAGGVVLVPTAPLHDCGGEVNGYRERDGDFDSDSFVRMWQWSAQQQAARPRFDSLLDCYALKPLVPLNVDALSTVDSTVTATAAVGSS